MDTYRTDESSYRASTRELLATLEDQGWHRVELSRDDDGVLALARGKWSALVTRGGAGKGPVVNLGFGAGVPAY